MSNHNQKMLLRSSGFNSHPAEANHQPEASLVWRLATGVAKRRQRVLKPCFAASKSCLERESSVCWVWGPHQFRRQGEQDWSRRGFEAGQRQWIDCPGTGEIQHVTCQRTRMVRRVNQAPGLARWSLPAGSEQQRQGKVGHGETISHARRRVGSRSILIVLLKAGKSELRATRWREGGCHV
jgi:hypothetical protein